MEIRECLAKENISYFHFELEKCPFVFTLFFKYLYRKQSGGKVIHLSIQIFKNKIKK
jgi:hypothetical protein